MSLIDKIPLPSANFGGDIADIPDLMEKIRTSKLARQQSEKLLPYQIQEMQGKAAKSQMLANLIEQAMKGNGQGGGSNNSALLASGLLGLPTHVIEGNIVTPFGSMKVGETPAERRQAQAKQKSASETLKSTSESAMGGLGVNASFDALENIMNNPSYKNIAGTMTGKVINSQPFGIPVGAMLQKNFPGQFSKEDAQLAGMANTHLGNIVTGVAAKFKGPFKQMVNGIINTMKPNMGDSIEVQKAKVKAWKQLSNLADKQNEDIAKYVNEGMDPTAAILKVAKETKFQDKLMDITSNVEGNDLSDQQSVQKQSAQQSDMQSNPADDQVLLDQASEAKNQLIKNGFSPQEADQMIKDRLRELRGDA